MLNEKMPDEVMLVSMLVNGQEEALEIIYNRYYNRVYLIALQFLKSPELAEEIVQDVFLKLWEKRETIDSDRPVEAWLYTVTKNRVINQFKKIARHQATMAPYKVAADVADAQPAADAKVINREIEQLLQEAINHLPEKQKEVYRLAREEGFSRKEIAEHMQISALTVKTHMSRAIVGVKSFLQHRGVSLSCGIAAWFSLFVA